MDGVGGYQGWRWIFLIEGMVTVMLGIATFFILVDTPALGHKWLQPHEIRFLNSNVSSSRAAASRMRARSRTSFDAISRLRCWTESCGC